MAVSRIVIGGNTVGIIDLEEIFLEVKKGGQAESEFVKDLIMAKVKAKNYIPSRLEPTYRNDLYEEFLVFTGKSAARRKESSVIEVRLYGASCSRCEQLDAAVKHILSRERLRVDYQHITDMREIAGAGILGTPALAVAGTVVTSGQVLPEKQLEKALLEAIDAAKSGRT